MIQNFIINKTDITLFTTNGFQMHGVITDASNEYIILNGDTMIFKHAISTIRPV